MIFGTSRYCHENTIDVEIKQNIYDFIQNLVINVSCYHDNAELMVTPNPQKLIVNYHKDL